jgi:hypothetical protein
MIRGTCSTHGGDKEFIRNISPRNSNDEINRNVFDSASILVNIKLTRIEAGSST